MPEPTNTYESELSTEVEVTEVAESSEAQSTDEPESQPEATESTESEKEEARNSKRVQKVNSFLTKIELGEATIDDAEPWMREDLKAKLNQNQTSTSDVEKIVAKQLEAIEEEKRFKQLNDSITGLDEQKDKVLKSKYNELRLAGLSKFQSLDIAMKYADVESSSSNLGTVASTGRASTPKGEKSIMDMTDDEIVAKTLAELPK